MWDGGDSWNYQLTNWESKRLQKKKKSCSTNVTNTRFCQLGFITEEFPRLLMTTFQTQYILTYNNCIMYVITYLYKMQMKFKILTSHQFNQLIRLWMQLCQLTERFYRIHSNLFAYQLIFLIVNGFSGLYLHARAMSTNLQFSDKSLQIEILIDIVLTIACFSGLILYTEEGYQLKKKVHDL